MNKCKLFHDDLKGFVLVDRAGAVISTVTVGDIDMDIDWDIVEEQAKKLGYELVD